MPLADDTWIVPTMPWAWLIKQEDRLAAHFDTYDAKMAYFLGAGWEFFDNTGTSLGSITSLQAHQDFYEASTLVAHQWDDWCARPHPFFPFAFPVGKGMSRYLHDIVFPDADHDTWDEDEWDTYRFFLLIADDREKFIAGWLQRHLFLICQLRIAFMVESCFCLDYRGRPVLV